MKKTGFTILYISLFSLSVSAQTVVVSFLEKYGQDDNIRVVSIGKKMFGKIQEQSLGTPELLEAIKGLENIQIVTSEDTLVCNEYFDSACSILAKAKDFTELLSAKNDDLQVIVKKKESKGIVNELIILFGDSKGFNLIHLTGKINLDLLAGYSAREGWKELEKLSVWSNN